MVPRLFGSAVGALALAAACGGTTVFENDSPGDGGSEPIASGGMATGGTGGQSVPDADVPSDAPSDAVSDVSSDYDAPVCPDVAAPEPDEQCDVFGDGSDCPVGTSCFPYVNYPSSDDDCAQESYGTWCLASGTGVQGEPCRAGDCAAGHLCVLTGDGTICVQLCSTLGENRCPAGLLCEPIDVQPGVGGCY